MKQFGGNRTRGRGPAAPVDPVEAIRHHAAKLFYRGDGRAVDWAAMAAALFKAGFACVDEAKGDERAARVVRRVQAGAYNRMAGIPDDDTPYTTAAPPRPPAGSGLDLAPGHDLTR